MKFFLTTLLFILLAMASVLTACRRASMKEASRRDATREVKQISRTQDVEGLQKLIETYRANGDSLLLMHGHRKLGKVYRENANFSEAIAAHRTYLDLASRLPDTLQITRAYNELGTDYRRIGAFSEALDYHHCALNVAEKYSDKSSKAIEKSKVVALNGIGNVSLSLGYNDDAERFFLKALDGEIKQKSVVGQAINYANLGAVYESKASYDTAHMYYVKSLECNKEVRSDLGEALCLNHLGRLFKLQKRYEEAEERYLEAYNLIEESPDRWHWLEACLGLAEINLVRSDIAEYEHYIDLAEKTESEISSPEHRAIIYDLRYRFANKQHNYSQALDYFKKSQAIQDSIRGVNQSNRYMDIRINYERERNQRSLKEIELQNAIEKAETQRAMYVSWALGFIGFFLAAAAYYAYRQRLRSNAALKQYEKARSVFFTNITHEFRTPLTVIQGLNRHLLPDSPTAAKERCEYVKTIDRQCLSLLGLVDQLLDISKLQRANMNIPPYRHEDIIAYMRAIVEGFRHYGHKNDIELFFRAEHGEIRMDFIPEYINKIINNLLSNAIKYSDSGSVVQVLVGKNQKGDMLSLRVIDNGRGIDPKDLPFIFDIFYRSDNNIRSMGSGVGLALTKKLVEQMGGDILVESVVGKGSTFDVCLPLKAPESSIVELDSKEESVVELPEFAASETLEASFLPKPEPDDTAGERSVILIVEDNADVTLYLRSILSPRYAIIIAQDGEQGIAKADKAVPDLIITDLMMPIKDGNALVKEVRQNPLTDHIPIIMLSAKSDGKDRKEGYRMGADAYLSKPFDPDELLIRVAQLLESRRLLREKYLNMLEKEEGVGLKAEDTESLEFVRKVTNIIHAEIANPELNVAFLADKMCVSTSQLTRKLNMMVGVSTIAYITRIRLAKAKQFLSTGQYNVNEVSDLCGFNDSGYFGRLFKKEFGVTPTDFGRISGGVK
ncbi:ATP-binding protein [Porphyromonas sp.]|uniref:ATP-binding protein n=1 Tax=Porphyromonas sp. TaxID=1924944 RepID=UPI0026DCAE71|nr:ATP-binding protein [Porphyromonas sp.]MDO4770407.1 response regulator [Porphyromonas sp.]